MLYGYKWRGDYNFRKEKPSALTAAYKISGNCIYSGFSNTFPQKGRNA
jgi:hypothetical protein